MCVVPPFQYIYFLCCVPPFATLGSSLDAKQSWESGKLVTAGKVRTDQVRIGKDRSRKDRSRKDRLKYRSSPARSNKVVTGKVKSGQVKPIWDRSIWYSSSQARSSQVWTGKVKSGQMYLTLEFYSSVDPTCLVLRLNSQNRQLFDSNNCHSTNLGVIISNHIKPSSLG